MADKSWKPFDDECPRCGSTSEVLTTCKDSGQCYDGDEARCTECKLEGCIVVDEFEDGEGIAVVEWCDCEIE